jgi:hypothetical protein
MGAQLVGQEHAQRFVAEQEAVAAPPFAIVGQPDDIAQPALQRQGQCRTAPGFVVGRVGIDRGQERGARFGEALPVQVADRLLDEGLCRYHGLLSLKPIAIRRECVGARGRSIAPVPAVAESLAVRRAKLILRAFRPMEM